MGDPRKKYLQHAQAVSNIDKPRNSSGTRYTDSQWVMVRALYLTGQFNSILDLHKHCKANNIPCPSVSALGKKCALEGWANGPTSDLVRSQQEQATEALYQAEFAKLGIDKKQIAGVVKQLLKGKHGTDKNLGLQRYMDLTGERAANETKHTGNAGSTNIVVLPSNGFEPVMPTKPGLDPDKQV